MLCPFNKNHIGMGVVYPLACRNCKDDDPQSTHSERLVRRPCLFRERTGTVM